jgi:hypothetical protein
MENLSAEDLETKINNVNNTVVTLRLALFEVKCDEAKKVIQLQIDNYTNTLRQMLSLLTNKQLER